MRRGVWRTLLGLGVGGLYVGVRVFAEYWDFNAASAELPQAVHDFRAAGLPWTTAALDRNLAPEQNAAPLIRKAIAVLPGKSADRVFDADLKRRKADPTPYEPALRIFHEAARLPDLDFERDWDLGPNLLFPEITSFKRACKAFAARAERRAVHGDDAGALSDLADARRLGELIGKSPTLIEALTSIACFRIAEGGFRACLIRLHDQPERLKCYQDRLSKPFRSSDLRAALRGEIYGVVALARNLDRQGVGTEFWPEYDGAVFCGEEPSSPIPQPRREGLPGNTRARAYFARALQYWTELAKTTDRLTAPWERIEARAEEIDARAWASKGWSHRLDAILFPLFSGYGRTDYPALAAQAVNVAFADALIHQARTGRWPSTTSIRDPWTAKPLRVRSDGRKFRTWSVGKDGKDDGGLTRSEALAKGKSSDDEVAIFPVSAP